MSRRPDRGAAELAAKKKPWAISRANTYRGAALPKGANTGGATLGGRSHARTRTDHNQRANSFGPNELRAIATSGDTMLLYGASSYSQVMNSRVREGQRQRTIRQ